MFDGMIRVLGNVRYVPRLRKNLISLGTLDEVDYGYESKKGRLRVAKGSLVVMQGDLQPNKLYKLIRTTIVEGAAVSVNQGIEDKTELWHHRLRHISQKGLQELHKQGLLEACHLANWTFVNIVFLESKGRSPSTVLNFKSAEEVWSEKPVDYSKPRVFNCSTYAHIPSDERKKVVSRDIVFNETTMPLNKVESSREKKDDAEIEVTKIPLISSDEEKAQVEQIEQDAESDGFEEKEEHQHCSPVKNQVEQETCQIEGTLIRQTSQRVRTSTNNPPTFQRFIALDKPNRNNKKPDRFGFNLDKVNYTLNISQGDPTTYQVMSEIVG
ncbi:hypothetical protein L3X38_041365 [Prunus dulcis]|uniref:GAG-pre-integrase domain-containing protein n=1 Tax=Prunus dulcis TaxID=3755 RepID=A0AAD4UUI7_PRUDU|nr:hypothetical protein L3X38_041365 [Prunus dulcis]